MRAGLHQTHKAFKSECSALSIPIQAVSSTDETERLEDKKPLVSEATIHHLLNAFDDADLDLFFKVIYDVIYRTRSNSKKVKKLITHSISVLHFYSFGITKTMFPISTMMSQRSMQK